MELSETFWVTFITMGFAFVTGSLAYTLKSKCNSVRFCGGCIDIQRDVELEADIEEHAQHFNEIPPATDPPPYRTRRSTPRRSHLESHMVDFAESMTGSVKEDTKK